MELSSVLFLVGFFLLLVAFVGWPFMQPVYRRSTDDQVHSSLLAERERLFTALNELDFDHNLGKIPSEDYQAERNLLIRQGAEVLRKLDELPKAPEFVGIQDPVEKKTISDDDVEDIIARRRSGLNGKTGGFCPKCGNPVLISDRFCPKCGKALK